jgi:hypothetical protein
MSQFSTYSDVVALAIAEMNAWGLVQKGWTFKVDNAKSRHGLCNYNAKRLSISRQRVDHDSKEDVVNTIRHEIAHALHYEEYVDAGKREDFFARRWTGRKWVRKVAPHGAEWKRVARKVGVKAPSASSAGNARKVEIQPWRLVLVNNGQVEDLETGYHRFPKRLSSRYMRGRKNTLGKLFLIKRDEWVAFMNGRKTVEQLSFYQDLRHAPVSNGIKSLTYL